MQIPELKGLVLIGGHSSRMGFDKSRINYHGMPQVDYMVSLLSHYVEQTYISGRMEQVAGCNYPFIEDVITGSGPMNGVLSAFRLDPESAWLIAACDMPLISQKTIRQLIKGRDPDKMATCFYDVTTELPEPLLSIWEREAFHFLQKQMKEGNQSLRNALKNGNCKIIEPEFPEELKNANTEEEMREMMRRINGGHFDPDSCRD